MKKEKTSRSVKLKAILGEWILILVLLGYPIFASISIVLGVPSNPLSVAYRIFYLLISIVIIVMTLGKKNVGSVSLPIAMYGIVGFWLVYLVRFLYDIELLGISRGYAARGSMFYFQFGILGSLIPAIAVCMNARSFNLERLWRNLISISFLTGICILYIISVEVGLSFQIFLLRTGLGGENGAVLNPITISQYGGIIFFLAFFKIIVSRLTIFRFLVLLIGFTLLLFGASRGPFVSVFLTMLLFGIYWLLKSFKSWKYWLRFFVFFAIGTIFVAIVVVPFLDQISIFNRFTSVEASNVGGEVRSFQWRAAWNQFISSPIYGDCIIEDAYNYYPHNLFLEILMSTGLVGMLLLTPAIYKSAILVFSRTKVVEKIFVLMCILYCVYCMFSLSMITIPQFWCLVALIINFKPRKSYFFSKKNGLVLS